MRVYTKKELKKLGTDKYVLIAIDGFVYDVTSFVTDHPGGP
jgi:cytochrome b involved in lipid metabolism